MDALIVGLLAFARAGRQPLERRSVDMDELARSAAAEMLAAHTGPSPRIRIDPLPRCHGDATALRQVWCNLIGNALKYSARRAEPSIGIRAVTDGHELVYQVEDNGAGFDMRQADKLFGVFQRLHSADEFTGTGVGLAIVARTLARHGGRIWAQAQPEQGATFFLALPRPKDLEARATPT
jgi:light-regulated signal transduction histidine kinase (bacteriophytochrome)